MENNLPKYSIRKIYIVEYTANVHVQSVPSDLVDKINSLRKGVDALELANILRSIPPINSFNRKHEKSQTVPNLLSEIKSLRKKLDMLEIDLKREYVVNSGIVITPTIKEVDNYG